jgi:hypothetical protein
MSRRRIIVVLAGSLVAVGIGAAGFAADDRATIKNMMGENFAVMQSILVALITSKYDAVPENIDIIHQHAVDLQAMAPKSPEADHKQFMVYAYNMQGHATDVKSIVELLIEHDKSKKSGEALNNDHLREALAAHYGGMVTMCVACHNHFRPQVVE